MKISVNRNIIETELIYLITDIISDCNDKRHFFKIKMFNNVELEISLNIILAHNEYKKYFDGSFSERKDIVKESESYLIQLDKISKFREEIITLWSNNQPKIPILELNK